MKILPGLVIFASLSTCPAWAHHSFEAEYDSKKPITVTGVVTKLEWENPHVYFYVDIKDAVKDGQTSAVENWKFEAFPPNVLVKLGWTRDETLKPGDVVTVFGWRARDGSALAHAREITLSDGKKILAGSASGLGAYFVPSGSK